MSKRWIIPVAAVAVTGGMAGSRALWCKPPGAGSEALAERKLDLTVYNQDFGMVHESRPFRLTAGANRLLLPDVSRQLDPHSVLLRWAGGADGPEIVGHSYELGAGDSQRLLSQQVGRPVELVRYGENGREASREAGRLLLAENGQPAAVQIGDEVRVNPGGTLVLPGEEAARAVPQLAVQARSSGAGSSLLDVAYLTRGLSWSADYVATLAEKADNQLDLECYATVTNRTGVPFPEANITLVTGTPNRAATAASAPKALPQSRAAGPGFTINGNLEGRAFEAPEAVGDLHAYPLKNPATIQNDELNRLLMFRRTALRARKEYSYGAPYLDGYSSPVQERGKIAVSLSFMNTPQDAVGLPLPQGTIRVYDPDRSGRLRYAGAGAIPPTPKNRKVDFTLAEAFDVQAAYRVTGTQKLGKRGVRKQVVVRLTNEKAHAVPVRVVQNFGQRWIVTNESASHTKLNAQAAQWTVPVPAGGATDLRYTVDLTW